MLVLAAFAMMAGPIGPPPEIVAQVAGELADAAGSGGPPPAGMIRPVDVNRDGVTDWHVDYEGAEPVAWCGSGGCRQVLYVSQPGGRHVVAFDENARAFAVRDGRVSVDIYGSYCGTAGVVECRRSFAWDAGVGRLVAVPDRRQDPRLFGPLFQPVPIKRADWPAAVVQAVSERTEACAAAGATLDEGDSAIVRSPDLDGDGREDWIVGSQWSSCRPPDDMAEAQANALPRPILVAVSGDSTSGSVIFQSATSDYIVDIATRPATLILVPDQEGRMRACPDRPTRCAGTVFSYDAEKKWLEPFTTPRPARRSPASR